jgi:cytochrome P450
VSDVVDINAAEHHGGQPRSAPVGVNPQPVSGADAFVSGTSVEFDPFSEIYFNDPYETYRQLRDNAPVYYNEQYGFWALSRYDDVAPAMKDSETYSSAKGVSLDMLIDPDAIMPSAPLIIMMDPPQHTRMRKLVNKVFTPRAVARLETMIRDTITAVADQIDPTSFDAVADFTTLFPVEVITTMLGVPKADRRQLRQWTELSLTRRLGDMGPTAEGIEASRSSAMYYYNLIQERHADPQDDMISRLTQVEVDRGDGELTKLTDIEIVGFVSILGSAGAETVAKLVASAVVIFADHQDQWEALRADRSKIPAAFEELLRFEGPVQYDVRHSMRDVHLHGRTIPKDSPVLMLVASATRDERVFPSPDRFDIDRKHSGHNLGFGYGIHSCLGAALARMEGRLALDTLLDLIPRYEIERSGLKRVTMTNVAGWSNVPVRILR